MRHFPPTQIIVLEICFLIVRIRLAEGWLSVVTAGKPCGTELFQPWPCGSEVGGSGQPAIGLGVWALSQKPRAQF